MKNRSNQNMLLVIPLCLQFLNWQQPIVTIPQVEIESCNSPANAIVAENCKEGTSDWQVWNLWGDIEGFASTTSVSPGEQIDFYINTNAENFDLNIYRSGYYGGKGGRLMYSVEDIPGSVQPECKFDRVLGAVNCGNWGKSYSLVIPEGWVSGIFIAKLIRRDSGGENYILFVVREKQPQADIVLQLSVTTYQAYNFYGNKSLYSSLSFDYCPTLTGAPRAVKISFDRPNSLGSYNQNTYLWTDYPMVYWLEAQGYDVGYITNIDTHRYGVKGIDNDLLKHNIFLSVGHDEYWSQEMRDAISEARDHGVHLGFFSSNVGYWRIRFEPNPLTGTPDRTEVAYKTTEGGPADPSGHPTTTWRDPDGANDPENALIGIQYIGDNDVHYFPLQVTTEQAQDRLYRNTSLQSMPVDSIARIGKHLIGWEWDAVVDNGLTPVSLSILAASPTNGSLLADAGRKYNFGIAESHVTRYMTTDGTIVFAAGTNHWSWGLAIYEPNPIIQQVTYNLLSDMGVQPASPADTLMLEDGSESGVAQQGQVQRDAAMVSAVENFLWSWAVPDFTMASESEPAFIVYKSREANSPEISGMKIKAGYDFVTVSWETDQPTSGHLWLKYKPGPFDYSVITESIGGKPIAAELLHEIPSTHHELTVDGLMPSSEYFLQVASTNGYGQTMISNEQDFYTQNGGAIGLQAKRYLRPSYRQVKCGWKANQGAIVVSGSLGLLVVGIVIFYLHRYGKLGHAKRTSPHTKIVNKGSSL